VRWSLASAAAALVLAFALGLVVPPRYGVLIPAAAPGSPPPRPGATVLASDAEGDGRQTAFPAGTRCIWLGIDGLHSIVDIGGHRWRVRTACVRDLPE
jgi:hypothetical protein